MKVNRIKVELYCNKCNKETVHEIIYFDNKIETINCTQCHLQTGIHYKELRKSYHADVLERILSKPHRMNDEMHDDLSEFFKKLPKRLLTKPKRITEEFKDVDDITHGD